MAARLAGLPPSGTLAVGEKVRASSDALTARLLDASGVAVTSGAVFGKAGEGHIRVNLVGPLPTILEGTQALLRGLPG